MKRQNHISLLLSLYLDGELSADERRSVESLIAQDEAVQKEFEQLSALRSMLADREPLPENPFLPERIMNRIHDRTEVEETTAFIPRRFMPVTATLAVVVLSAIAVFAWIQRDQIFQYVADTGTQVQQAYEESILKGWIMPLFERTDRDQVLHFAMFGTLPLDAGDGTMLRVDDSAEDGYRIELSSSGDPEQPMASLHDLYEEIQPTDSQRKVFDTLFLYAQRQIESSVLMNDEKELAIDPAISTYQKVILSGIAASLENDQLVRFERFLNDRNTPYTLVAQTASRQVAATEAPTQMIRRIRSSRMPEEFVVLAHDEQTPARIRLDMDSLRRLMRVVENRMPRLDVRFEQLARMYQHSDTHGVRTVSTSPVRVISHGQPGGLRTVTISIQTDAEDFRSMEREMNDMMRHVAVMRREKAELQSVLAPRGRTRDRHSTRRVEVVVTPNAEMEVHVNVDSILQDAFEPLQELEMHFDMRFDDETDGMRQHFEWRQIVPRQSREALDSLLKQGLIDDDAVLKRLQWMRDSEEPSRPRRDEMDIRDRRRLPMPLPVPDAPEHARPVQPTTPPKTGHTVSDTSSTI